MEVLNLVSGVGHIFNWKGGHQGAGSDRLHGTVQHATRRRPAMTTRYTIPDGSDAPHKSADAEFAEALSKAGFTVTAESR